jgi:hypothetical protein
VIARRRSPRRSSASALDRDILDRAGDLVGALDPALTLVDLERLYEDAAAQEREPGDVRAAAEGLGEIDPGLELLGPFGEDMPVERGGPVASVHLEQPRGVAVCRIRRQLDRPLEVL